jgi:pilus assembly protein CpaB
VVREEVQTNTTQVLVAKTEIGLGHITSAENFRWQDWSQSSVGPQYIQRSARPNAISDFAGAVARSPMLPGEPITALKLVKAGDGGVLARSCRPACGPSRRASRRRRRRVASSFPTTASM